MSPALILAKKLSFFMMTAFLTMLVSTGCEKEVEVIVPEKVIIVDSVYVLVDGTPLAADGEIDQGATVSLTATTSINPDVEATVGAITLHWYSQDGVFNAEVGDTVEWKVPDDDGAYVVAVHATDGTYIGIAERAVGVGIYAPTATPFYISEQSCAACHGANDLAGAGYDIHTAWSETHHAEAWEALQESGHAASYCEKCHTVGTAGYAFGDGTGDSGWDEAPIAKFQNVQCENCHGPGSDHAGVSTGGAGIQLSYDASLCGSCHDGEHQPYYSEWGGNTAEGYDPSPHAFDASTDFRASNAFCQGCHEGVAAAKRFDAIEAGTNTFYGGGSISDRPLESELPWNNISCAVCHSPHKHDNPSQLRTVADVQLVTANGESPVITLGGSGKLCMQCHHARRGPDIQILEGYAYFGPHANPQADMLAGKSAFLGVAQTGEDWPEASHLKVQNACKTCHLNMIEYGGTGSPAVTGHSFLPTVEACANCHGSIADFDDILALDDFDDDGTTEGIQSEVGGLMAILESALIDSFISIGADTVGGFDLAHALGDTLFRVLDGTTVTDSSLVPQLWREAGYNWVFIEDDKSHGVHNPDFAVRLLQRSYRHLTGLELPNMTRPFQKVVAWN